MKFVEFHETRLGKLPVEWDVASLGAVLSMKAGSGLTGEEIAEVGPYPVYGGNGQRGYTSRYTHDGRFVLIGRQGALCGNIAVASGKFFATEHAIVCTPLRPINAGWLACYLERMNLNRFSEASAQPGLSVQKLLYKEIALPSFDEQSSIAAVLDCVDEAIRKSETVIKKLRQVRTGLIHDLLTCGIDEFDRLRDPVAHSEEFKDSPLGSVPLDWTVAPLRNFLSSAEYGISTSLKGEGMLPVLRMNNLKDGEAELSDLKFATFDVPRSLHLRVGDVLFNRTNSYEHVGKTCIWRGQLPVATFASYLVRLNPAPGKLGSEFLNLVLNLPEYQLRMRRFATPAVQQVNINPTSLQQMLVAIPRNIAEQERIVVRALESARSIITETAELAKLQHVRFGLMDDLLTGRVRMAEAIR